MREAYGTTLVCDDVRQEFDGKVSLIGVYGPDIIFGGTPPGQMLKLCFAVQVWIPSELPFTKFELKALQQDETSTVELASDVQTVAPPSPGEFSDETYIRFMQYLILTNHHFPGPCTLMVRAYLDDDVEIRCGTTGVLFVSDDEADAEQPTTG